MRKTERMVALHKRKEGTCRGGDELPLLSAPTLSKSKVKRSMNQDRSEVNVGICCNEAGRNAILLITTTTYTQQPKW